VQVPQAVSFDRRFNKFHARKLTDIKRAMWIFRSCLKKDTIKTAITASITNNLSGLTLSIAKQTVTLVASTI